MSIPTRNLRSVLLLEIQRVMVHCGILLGSYGHGVNQENRTTDYFGDELEPGAVFTLNDPVCMVNDLLLAGYADLSIVSSASSDSDPYYAYMSFSAEKKHLMMREEQVKK